MSVQSSTRLRTAAEQAIEMARRAGATDAEAIAAEGDAADRDGGGIGIGESDGLLTALRSDRDVYPVQGRRGDGHRRNSA